MPGLENSPELETGFLKKQRAQFLHFAGSLFSVWSIQQRKSEHMLLWEASCPRWSLVAASWDTQFRWFSGTVSLGLLPTAGGGLVRGFWLPRTGLRRPVCWLVINQYYQKIKASLVAQTVKSLPAVHVSVGERRSVMSDSLCPQGLFSPWNSPGQNTGVGSLSLLQGIFPTQGSNPGRLYCRWILYQLSHQGSRRPGFDPWVRKIPWRRKWQPTWVFLPGESHGQRSLAGNTPWGRKESGMTERLTHTVINTQQIMNTSKRFCSPYRMCVCAQSLQSCPTLWPHEL